MRIKHYAQKLKLKFWLIFFKLQHLDKKKFECPICHYMGPFMDVNPPTGIRKHAKCPKCKALERHRIQYLVVMRVLKSVNASKMKMLHVAPEAFFRSIFNSRFGEYETADINMKGVDHAVDLQHLPFDDASYDVVFASHVLEHIPDDKKAIKEIYRILKPSGIAILPVPLICEKTIEYPTANPNEAHHVRAPGMDYFERYEQYFSTVEKISTTMLPEKYQLFVYEDRSRWPTKECPLRSSTSGEKHIDIVPVCYV